MLRGLLIGLLNGLASGPSDGVDLLAIEHPRLADLVVQTHLPLVQSAFRSVWMKALVEGIRSAPESFLLDLAHGRMQRSELLAEVPKRRTSKATTHEQGPMALRKARMRKLHPVELAKQKQGRNASRRKKTCSVRPRTIAITRESKMVRKSLAMVEPEDGLRRLPMLRADCIDEPRPCPYVSCKRHLFLDVSRVGNILLNFPDMLDKDWTPRLDELEETCSLDVADRGGSTQEEAARLLSITRERIRQITEIILVKLKDDPIVQEIRESFDLGRYGDVEPDASDDPVAKRNWQDDLDEHAESAIDKLLGRIQGQQLSTIDNALQRPDVRLQVEKMAVASGMSVDALESAIRSIAI